MQRDALPTPVLVADDEETLLRLCGRVLVKGGYEMLPARTGDDAVRIFAERGAEVRTVVIDATIPPDGAASAVQAMLKLRDGLRVVFTSGADLDEELQALVRDRAGVFLRKPFPATALLLAVAEPRLGET